MPWRRRADTLFRQVPDGVLVISLAGGEPVFLPPPGDVVWALLDEPLAIDELVARLAVRFDAEPGVMAADCRTLLAELEAEGLIEAEGAVDQGTA
jgi:hypothetical protein